MKTGSYLNAQRLRAAALLFSFFTILAVFLPGGATALELSRNGTTYAIPLVMPEGVAVEGNDIDKTLNHPDFLAAMRLIQDPVKDCRPLVEARVRSRLDKGFRFKLLEQSGNSETRCTLVVRNHETGEDIASFYVYLKPCDCFAALHFYYRTLDRPKVAVSMAPIVQSLDDYAYERNGSSVMSAEPAVFSDPKVTLHAEAFNLLQIMDNGGPMACNISFEGLVEDGDTARLVKAYETLRDSPRYKLYREIIGRDRIILCLSSTGGSFVEALKFVEAGLPLTTMVQSDASCLSACSIMFMAGLASWPGEGVTISRFLEPGGQLGFHTPSLEVTGENYRSAEVNRAYRLAIRSIYEILHRLTVSSSDGYTMTEVEGLDRFPPSLLMYMLKTPPDGMFFVDTVWKAARWRIGLNYTQPLGLDGKKLTRDHFEWACVNILEWDNREDRDVEADWGEPGWMDMIRGEAASGAPAEREADGSVRIVEYGYRDYECVFEADEDELRSSYAPSSNVTNWSVRADYGAVQDGMPDYFNLDIGTFLDPQTPLAALR